MSDPTKHITCYVLFVFGVILETNGFVSVQSDWSLIYQASFLWTMFIILTRFLPKPSPPVKTNEGLALLFTFGIGVLSGWMF